MPVLWHFGYVGQQLVTLVLVGVLLVFALQGGALYDFALGDLAAYVLVIPFPLPLDVAIPLWAPLVLGLPLVMTPYRTPLLVWMTIILLVLFFGVVELFRVPWVAVSGANFYFSPDDTLNSGAVPFLRTFFSTLTLLAVLAVLAHQAVHLHVDDLLERGVPLADVRAVRGRLLALERGVLVAAAGGALILTLVVGVSMDTISARGERGAEPLTPFLFVALTVGVMLVGLGVGVARGRRG